MRQRVQARLCPRRLEYACHRLLRQLRLVLCRAPETCTAGRKLRIYSRAPLSPFIMALFITLWLHRFLLRNCIFAASLVWRLNSSFYDLNWPSQDLQENVGEKVLDSSSTLASFSTPLIPIIARSVRFRHEDICNHTISFFRSGLLRLNSVTYLSQIWIFCTRRVIYSVS